ncbi:MAG: SDR family NAD(P)-dependent oxidoreductase [Deltaproteobacteria bacterium]|nr:SDR family NAD(P)-dependent oxidoreductase [Deltaproteobacteria bacterium]
MGLLDGKVAIVTGAGGGIGREHALALAAAGAAVVVNDLGGARDGSGTGHSMADGVVDEIRKAGGTAVASYDNVATVAGGQAILQGALDAFHQVDVLVNNAGILRDKTLAKMEEAEWDAVIAVHLKGAYCVTRPVFNHMRDAGRGGSIINTSSTSGLEGNFGQTNYGAAKAGIAGFTRCLAIEGHKYGVRVNAIAPVALTRMTEDLPLAQNAAFKDRMSPQQIAPLIVYLASDLAKEVSKKIFFVGGGQISEMRMVRTQGATKAEGLWSPEEIAGRIGEILA